MRRTAHRSDGALAADFGPKAGWRGRRGMTLMELILVMGLLATVLAFSAPMLSRFFRGRDLTEETRRFLSLARYARGEAASRSARIEIYLEPETGRYGLIEEGNREAEGDKRREFELANGLRFEVNPESLDETGRATILFWPDGSIDEESLESFRIVEANEDNSGVEIARDVVGTGYFQREMETNS